MAKNPKLSGTVAERAFAAQYREQLYQMKHRWCRARRFRSGQALARIDSERVRQFVFDYPFVEKCYTPTTLQGILSAINAIVQALQMDEEVIIDFQKYDVYMAPIRRGHA